MTDRSEGAANDLDFESLLPDAPFRELHTRTIAAPVESVWATFLALPADHIRLLRPLFAVRALPARLKRERAVVPFGERPALDLFEDEGFVTLRRDDTPTHGHAVLIFGAAGKFWAPAHNGPMSFGSADEFLDFDEPGNAKTVARFEVWGNATETRFETETIVDVTDPASKAKFGAYWALIRGPSGLLRRSWLAAIDRG